MPVTVPVTGEKSALFGVFKSHCCGDEITILSGTVFPACPDHPQIRVLWIPIKVGPDNVIEFPKDESKLAKIRRSHRDRAG
jgi:hypothetical protein